MHRLWWRQLGVVNRLHHQVNPIVDHRLRNGNLAHPPGEILQKSIDDQLCESSVYHHGSTLDPLGATGKREAWSVRASPFKLTKFLWPRPERLWLNGFSNLL